MKKLYSLLLISLLFGACKDSTVKSPATIEYGKEGSPALIMVIENSDNVNQQLEAIAYNSYRIETLDILSEIFSVPIDSLVNKDLNQILDQYGEPWQIEEITKVASSYYNKIVTLTDESATVQDLIDSLSTLSGNGYTIDMVFSLHGNETSITFNDGNYPISDFTNELQNRNINIRTLYQTNCKSARAIDLWSKIGVSGCNGTLENNYLTIFAPYNFIKSWVSGNDYSQSVDYAYDTEIEKLKSFNNKLPLLDYITTGNYLSGSLPIISGKNIFITKDDYPIHISQQ